MGDKAEVEGLKKFFKNVRPPRTVYSLKGIMGHTLSASGVIEAIVGIKALEDKLLPANINLDELDEELLDESLCFPNSVQKTDAKCFLSNSFAFGGHNSSLIIGKQYLE